MDFFFCTVPSPHFLGRALIWPGYFGEHVLGLFEIYPSSLSKSVGFVSLSWKASWFLFLLLSYFYDPGMFIFRWSSNFVEKVERERDGEDGILCLLPCILLLYRVNLNKLSRNFVGALRTTTTNCRVSFIDIYLVFLRNFRIVQCIFTPYKHCNFIGTTLWYYHRAWVTCAYTN